MAEYRPYGLGPNEGRNSVMTWGYGSATDRVSLGAPAFPNSNPITSSSSGAAKRRPEDPAAQT